MKKFHYTYLTSDGDRFYIGVRSCNCQPYADTYMGSHTDKTYKPTKKWILKVFSNRRSAEEHELWLQKYHKVVTNKNFVNKCYRKNGFNVEGRRYKMTENHKENLSKSHRGKPTPWMKGNKNRLGHKNTDYQKQKAREAQLGKPKSKQCKQRISESKRDKTIWHWINERTGEERFCTYNEQWRYMGHRYYSARLSNLIKGQRRMAYGWVCCCLLP